MELQTAINSMYGWYERAAICFIYLQDVPSVPADMAPMRDLDPNPTFMVTDTIIFRDYVYRLDSSVDSSDRPFKWKHCPSGPIKNPADGDIWWIQHYHSLRSTPAVLEWCSQLANSRWFTRGWTLQELIASKEADFLDGEWGKIASKSEGDFQWVLNTITGISKMLLAGVTQLGDHSVAEKMHWAHKRRTSRDEDIAYCLLGIFGVSMPLMYGEGGRIAFRRLQRTILESGCDNSIFLWTDTNHLSGNHCDLFANSPWDFRRSAMYTLERFDSLPFEQNMNMTALIAGIEFTASLIPASQVEDLLFYGGYTSEPAEYLRWIPWNEDIYLLLLTDRRDINFWWSDDTSTAGILVKRLTRGQSQFCRVFASWNVHINADLPYAAYMNSARTERIRIGQGVQFMSAPCKERNIQLSQIQFKLGLLRFDEEKAEHSGLAFPWKPFIRENQFLVIKCEQVNPWCSQIALQLDLRSLPDSTYSRSCICRDLPHVYVLSFISADRRVSESDIIERTFLVKEEGIKSSSELIYCSECRDCKVIIDLTLKGNRLEYLSGLDQSVGVVSGLSIVCRPRPNQAPWEPLKLQDVDYKVIHQRDHTIPKAHDLNNGTDTP